MHNCLSIDYIRKSACSRYAGKNCRAKNWHTDTLYGSAIDLRFDFLKNTDKNTFFHRVLFKKKLKEIALKEKFYLQKKLFLEPKVS